MAPTYQFKNGRMLIEGKDQIKARLGRSPDHSDALALTFATVDQPAADPFNTGFMPQKQSGRKLADFDPHRNFGDEPTMPDPFLRNDV